MLSQFARGGKTTALKKLAEKLHEEGILPILISFNGQDGGVSPRDVEDDKSALLRQISRQLLVNEARDEAVYTEQQLEDYFRGAGKPVVLLVDELNKLQTVLEHETARFLREVFQNKKDRAFVFTTHRPFLSSGQRGPADSADSMQHSAPEGPQPARRNLRGADATRALTRAQAVQLMMCPALVYCFHVDRRSVRCPEEQLWLPKKGPALAAFCREFLTGREALHRLNPLYREFTAVSHFDPPLEDTPVRQVRWPLVYVASLFDTPGWTDEDLAARGLSSVEMTDTENDGRVWELVVLQAFQVRCLLAREEQLRSSWARRRR